MTPPAHRWLLAFAACAIVGPPSPLTAQGAVDTDHDIRLPASDTVKVGAARSISLTITPAPSFEISRASPLTIQLTTPAAADDTPAIILLKRRYHRRDAADPRADAPRFDIHYRARASGTSILQLSLSFWVCDRRSCRPVTTTRTVRIEIQSE